MKRNLILLILCAVIAAFYFWDKGQEEKKKDREDKEKQLVTITQDEVNEITIVKGEETIKAVKNGENWRLTEPFDTSGDKIALNAIARNFATSKRERVINDNPESLAPFGLDAPTIKISVAGIDDATKTTMLLGANTPVSGKYYAMVEGASDIVTITESLYRYADKSLFDLRDKKIVDMEFDTVQKFEVEYDGEKLTLHRVGSDEWIATEPMTARIDGTTINDIVRTAINGEIKQFIEEEPEMLEIYGLVEPATKLVFWGGEPGSESSWASQALLIGTTSTATENWYAKREGQKNVFAVGPQSFNKLTADLNSLRLKKIASKKSWEVDRVKITSAGSVILEASKDGGDWTLLQPKQGKANFSSVSDALRAITDLEAATFVEGATEEYGLGEPSLLFELQSSDGGETIALASSVKDASGNVEYFYGSRSNPSEIYGVEASVIDELMIKTAVVRLEPTPEPEPEPGTTEEGTIKEGGEEN